MQLIINPSYELPIYRQIMRQITDAIAGGWLKSGDKLASHRELSEQLVVAPLTVKKAYDELEIQGLLETHRGKGTFVSARLPQLDPTIQLDQIRQAARKLLAQAYLAGLGLADVIEAVKRADHELSHTSTTPQKQEQV